MRAIQFKCELCSTEWGVKEAAWKLFCACLISGGLNSCQLQIESKHLELLKKHSYSDRSRRNLKELVDSFSGESNASLHNLFPIVLHDVCIWHHSDLITFCWWCIWSIVIRHPKRHPKEQSHPELRHKIQCERCLSTGGLQTRTRTKQRSGRFFVFFWVIKIQTLFRKVQIK